MLARHGSAIDGEGDAVDEGRLVGGEVDGRCGDLLGHAEAAERDVGEEALDRRDVGQGLPSLRRDLLRKVLARQELVHVRTACPTGKSRVTLAATRRGAPPVADSVHRSYGWMNVGAEARVPKNASVLPSGDHTGTAAWASPCTGSCRARPTTSVLEPPRGGLRHPSRGGGDE